MLDRVTVATEIAVGAGALLKRSYEQGTTVSHKGMVDLVTEADAEAEAFIIQQIRRSYPEHAILAEESGAHAGRGDEQGEWRWVVDPLDGTVNFAHKNPHFCVLIALQRLDENSQYVTELGVTYDPLRSELFTACAGKGAFCNGKPICVSSAGRLLDALLATGFGYERLFSSRDNHREFCRLNLLTQGVRRFGSAGLDLAYLACGRYDGFWEYGLSPWDLTSGVLLIEEAGGVVSDVSLDVGGASSAAIVASNGLLHKDLVHALRGAEEYPINDRHSLLPFLPDDVAERLQRTLAQQTTTIA